jgi:hypothetical protein
MRPEEAYKLVEDWTTAVNALWKQVVDKAKAGEVAVPLLAEQVGGIKIILSERGIEAVLGSTGVRFVDLLKIATFKLSDFPAIRKFVVDSVRKAHVDIDKSIEDRQDAFSTAFNDLKKEIAEWNLTCQQGKELRQ